MILFSIKHGLRAVAIFIAVTFATFMMVYSNGPGIARGVLGLSATNVEVQHEVVRLGLDQPLLVQYVRWFGGLLRGDLGSSYFTSQSVTATLAIRFPVTLSLVVVTLALTVLVTVLVGVAAAVYGGWIDRVLQVVATIGGAVPSFVIAIGLVFALAVAVRLFPATGYIPLRANPGPWLASITLPVAAILVGSIGGAASQFRGSVKEILDREYIRTLRSRGMSERAVIFRHVLRNAAGPGLTVLSMQTIGLLGGVVVIEQVFALPGIGSLASGAAQQGDIPVIMGCVVVTVIIVLGVNLANDLANSALTPKAKAT